MSKKIFITLSVLTIVMIAVNAIMCVFIVKSPHNLEITTNSVEAVEADIENLEISSESVSNELLAAQSDLNDLVNDTLEQTMQIKTDQSILEAYNSDILDLNCSIEDKHKLKTAKKTEITTLEAKMVAKNKETQVTSVSEVKSDSNSNGYPAGWEEIAQENKERWLNFLGGMTEEFNQYLLSQGIDYNDLKFHYKDNRLDDALTAYGAQEWQRRVEEAAAQGVTLTRDLGGN